MLEINLDFLSALVFFQALSHLKRNKFSDGEVKINDTRFFRSSSFSMLWGKGIETGCFFALFSVFGFFLEFCSEFIFLC